MRDEAGERALDPVSAGSDAGGGAPAVFGPRSPSRLLKVSSRVAVWGVSGAVVSIFAFSVGAPVSSALALDLFGGGLMVGGLGAAVAGLDVLRRAPSRLRLVRATALLGVPVGLGIAFLGAIPLLELSFSIPVLLRLVPVAGLVFLVLAVASFLSFWMGGSDEPGPGT